MNCRYSMLIQWSDEDQAYVVTLPEFHSCKTHGTSYVQAAKNGEEVLELLIETYQAESRPLPTPTKFSSASPEFWRMIEERRREPTVPLEDIKAELFADED